MTVALVRPRPDPESIGLQSFMICEPLELEYAVSYLASLGHRAVIIDMMFERGPLASCLKGLKPDAVGFTAYICHVDVVKRYAREVKAAMPGCVTMVGGVHAEVAPADFEDGAVDYVLHVNGLRTMGEVLSSAGLPREEVRKKVAGAWNGPGKEYAIDTSFPYPLPDRSATKKYRNRYDYIFHRKCATVKTSFGCTFKCDFCFCTAITRGKYFERPIAEVVDEIAQIAERNIFIVDDNFLFNVGRVREFIRLMSERELGKRFILFGRADFIAAHEDVILGLKGVGLCAVFVGIESFRERDLADFKKRTSVETNGRAVRILESNGLECYSGIIVGRDWTRKDFDGLISTLRGFRHPIVNIQPLTPMPETPAFGRMKGEIGLPRDRYAFWDMAHLVWVPLRMSVRRYYWNIVRAYNATMTGIKNHFYVLFRYGPGLYLHVARGVIHIWLQYVRLIIRGRL